MHHEWLEVEAEVEELVVGPTAAVGVEPTEAEVEELEVGQVEVAVLEVDLIGLEVEDQVLVVFPGGLDEVPDCR